MKRDKDIIEEISKLKQVKPDGFYVKETKDKLLALMRENKYNKNSVKERFFSFERSKEFSYKLIRNYGHRVLKPVGALFLALAIITSGGVGISFASQKSIPGDAFYPVKLTIEQAQISLKTNEEDKVKLEVEFAGRRLEELNKVKVQEIINNKKSPENAKIALNNFKRNIQTVNERLEKMKTQKFTKETVEIVNIVEEKTLAYSKTLGNISSADNSEKQKQKTEYKEDEKINNDEDIIEDEKENDEDVDNEEAAADEKDKDGDGEESEEVQNNEEDAVLDEEQQLEAEDAEDNYIDIKSNKNNEDTEMEKVLKEAMEVSEEANIKAVDIIMEKHRSGEINIPQNELVERVQTKADNFKIKMKDLQEKAEMIEKAEETAAASVNSEDVVENEEDDMAKEDEEAEEDILPEDLTENLDSDTIATATPEIVEISEKPSEEIGKLNNSLDEIDELLEQGEIFNAFDKVKEIDALRKDLEDKMDIAEEKVINDIEDLKNKEEIEELEEAENAEENSEGQESEAEEEEVLPDSASTTEEVISATSTEEAAE